MLNTLLKLKKMAKKGITGMRALGFIFFRPTAFVVRRVKKILFL